MDHWTHNPLVEGSDVGSFSVILLVSLIALDVGIVGVVKLAHRLERGILLTFSGSPAIFTILLLH